MTDLELDVCLGHFSDIPPGEGRTFAVGGERIAVFHSRPGQIFAVQAACPHKGGPLADGLIGGNTLICPLHGWKFDLASGEALLGHCNLKTYPVRLDTEGRIVLKFDQS